MALSVLSSPSQNGCMRAYVTTSPKCSLEEWQRGTGTLGFIQRQAKGCPPGEGCQGLPHRHHNIRTAPGQARSQVGGSPPKTLDTPSHPFSGKRPHKDGGGGTGGGRPTGKVLDLHSSTSSTHNTHTQHNTQGMTPTPTPPHTSTPALHSKSGARSTLANKNPAAAMAKIIDPTTRTTSRKMTKVLRQGYDTRQHRRQLHLPSPRRVMGGRQHHSRHRPVEKNPAANSTASNSATLQMPMSSHR